MLKASIVIPAFNAQKTLSKCLDGLMHQTVPESQFEISLVDDGSTDDTVTIASRFKSVTILRQKNAGPAKARNRGAQKAKAPIVVFLDSDCVPKPDWLAQMLAPFSDENVAGVQGCYENGVNHWMAKFVQLEIEERYELLKKSMQKTGRIDFVSTYSAAYRKKIFFEMGGFDEGFRTASGEDTDLSFRLSEKGYKLVFAPKAVVQHFHPTSLFKYFKTKFFRAYWRVRLYRQHPEKIKNDSYTTPLIKIQMALVGAFVVFFVGTSVSLIMQAPNISSILFQSAIYLLFAAFLLTFPVAFFIFKKDWRLGILAPFVLTFNTFLFDAGYLYGLLKLGGKN